MEKTKVGVIFGGRSGEHEVSLRSAASIINAIDTQNYEILPIKITRQGSWFGCYRAEELLEDREPGPQAFRVLWVTDPCHPGLLRTKTRDSWIVDQVVDQMVDQMVDQFIPLDVVFPVLHGPGGEDGTVQGLLELAGIPYVGSGVLSSALGMDKVAMKQVYRELGLPVGDYLHFKRTEWQGREETWVERIKEKLGWPCFVKPANLGSSVGISKVQTEQDLPAAVEDAFQYDTKVLVESFIRGREIECSVLGGEDPRASLPGEVIPCNEFYDYRAKYIDDRSELIIPAELPPHLVERIQELSIKAFKAIDASGLARVDFFVDRETSQVIINEINTMPGFTSISMYPKLWEVSGIPYPQLVEQLLELARHKKP